MKPTSRLLALCLASSALAVTLAAPALAAAPRISRTATRSVVSSIPKQPVATTLPRSAAVLTGPVEVEIPACHPDGQMGGGSYGGTYGDEGSIEICGPSSGIEIENAGVQPVESSAPPEAKAYDIFGTYHNGLDMVQAYLMSVAAFYIYEPLDVELDEGEFPGWLSDTMEQHGLQTRFFEDEDTDTQAAVLWNDDVVILTFRGTTPGADMVTDLQKNFRRMPESWGDQVLVHNGFAVSWLNIRDEIIAELEDRLVGGRRLWITGHSLGGAIATLAAYDLEAVEGLGVEGVHTFGQPRVGADSFYEHFMDAGLFARFHRWQIEGDPIPTFFGMGSYTECVWICTIGLYTYEHVGRTHDILTSGGPQVFDYTFDTDVEDHMLGWHPGGAEIEHVKYDNALMDRLMQYEKDSMIDLMPPLAADSTPSGWLP